MGIPKKFETSFFFTIEDVQTFRKKLTNVIPFITTSTQAQEKRSAISEHKRLAFEQGNEAGLVPCVGVTLAFSALGLTKVWIIIFVAQVTTKTRFSILQLNITDLVDNSAFTFGQRSDAESFLRDNMDNWISAFKDGVHGVFVVASDSPDTINSTYEQIREALNPATGRLTIRDVFRADGAVRPGDQAGHEQCVL